MPNNIIQKNKAKCLHCGDILISSPDKKVETCSCGKVTVKGGHSFIMRVGKRGVDYEELSILNYNGVEKTYKEEKDSNDKV
jgi:hypothetical protein